MLVLSAHIGNWDLLACSAGLCGLKVNVVTRRIKTFWLNQFWMAQREACGVRLLQAEQSALAIRSALRRNEIVAFVLDQHQPDGIGVPFFNRPAATSTGLARLARATGAPVVPVFLLRNSQGFRLVVEKPLRLVRTRFRHQDCIENTNIFSMAIEQQVRHCPAQWLWVHRRWKLANSFR